MITLRRAEDRGYADHGWLKSHHTFSFGSYYDPQHMGFRSLRVMNEDRVAAGKGFGTHAHENMEIVSYVLEGQLEHKDSMGNGEVLRLGEFQRITAGTGITHSEFNPSSDHDTHFYQIWLQPERDGIEPDYEQKSFDVAGRQDQWQLVASPDGVDGSLSIHQDARIFLANLTASRELTYPVPTGRYAWLQILRGGVSIDGEFLQAGDAAAISDASPLQLQAGERTELMLFDLA